MTLEWLIIGGGIQGVHLAARLIGEAGIDPSELRIVDPAERLLERWSTVTATTGMSHLRSPVVHHLALDPWSLKRFATKGKKKSGVFAPPHNRPRLALFNAHCTKVIDRFGLSDLHVRARAEHCLVEASGVCVELSSGIKVKARNVLLAIGSSEQPEWPHWAPKDDDRIQHVFQPGVEDWSNLGHKVVVVGGGISAGQVALRLINEGHCVALVSRHSLRKHQFDSDTGWLGPKFMTSFSRNRNFEQRRAMITKARHRGSVPPDVFRALKRAIDMKKLKWHECFIEDLQADQGALSLQFADGSSVEADHIILATGFSAHRPGGMLIDNLVASAKLPCARCGYPITDSALRWHPRIYVAGPLAELELGPVSRNIAGARRAGDRIVDAVLSGKRALSRKAS